MDQEKFKKGLGEGLCEYCPWANGEIPHRRDAVCEGDYCDYAIDNFLDENEDYFDEFETLKDGREWGV